MVLTKNDIVEQIQNQPGFPKNQSKKTTASLLGIMNSAMESDDNVLVFGFGKVCVKEKTERKGRNPATDQEVILPARPVVTFKCSRRLRDKVNGG